jgi:hypothetical protein
LRLYTACDGNQPVLTINAGSELEARRVLSALGVLGANHAIRRASALEVEAWMGSATQPREQLRRLAKKTPTPIGDAGAKDHQRAAV